MTLHARNGHPADVPEVSYVTASQLRRMKAPLLAVIRYGTHEEDALPVDCPTVTVPMHEFHDRPLLEVWSSRAPVTIGRRHRIHYAANGRALFGMCRLEEGAAVLLDQATATLYRDIIRLTREQGYPRLLRMWNHYEGIDRHEQGLERYHRFCLGRYRAFAEGHLELERALPAASVLGTSVAGLIVYFLAAREPGIPIENPRQVSAFRYPPQYSPQSPSFSRAMLKSWGSSIHLYVSGTASIVGYETRHPGDAGRQAQEILRNIEALLEQATDLTGAAFCPRSSDSLYKIYLRSAEHFAVVHDVLAAQLGWEATRLFLQGYPCRNDLLVEMEAIYACSSAPAIGAAT